MATSAKKISKKGSLLSQLCYNAKRMTFTYFNSDCLSDAVIGGMRSLCLLKYNVADYVV